MPLPAANSRWNNSEFPLTRGKKMPLTKKGKKIMASMKKEYGGKKGKQIFYASQNKGTIKGTHKKKKSHYPKQ